MLPSIINIPTRYEFHHNYEQNLKKKRNYQKSLYWINLKFPLILSGYISPLMMVSLSGIFLVSSWIFILPPLNPYFILNSTGGWKGEEEREIANCKFKCYYFYIYYRCLFVFSIIFKHFSTISIRFSNLENICIWKFIFQYWKIITGIYFSIIFLYHNIFVFCFLFIAIFFLKRKFQEFFEKFKSIIIIIIINPNQMGKTKKTNGRVNFIFLFFQSSCSSSSSSPSTSTSSLMVSNH